MLRPETSGPRCRPPRCRPPRRERAPRLRPRWPRSPAQRALRTPAPLRPTRGGKRKAAWCGRSLRGHLPAPCWAKHHGQRTRVPLLAFCLLCWHDAGTTPEWDLSRRWRPDAASRGFAAGRCSHAAGPGFARVLLPVAALPRAAAPVLLLALAASRAPCQRREGREGEAQGHDGKREAQGRKREPAGGEAGGDETGGPQCGALGRARRAEERRRERGGGRRNDSRAAERGGRQGERDREGGSAETEREREKRERGSHAQIRALQRREGHSKGQQTPSTRGKARAAEER